MVRIRINKEKKNRVLSEKSGLHILRKVQKGIEKVHGEYIQNT